MMFKSKFSKIIACTMVISLLVTGFVFAESSPKYVFYLIGDGMGAAQRQITELYKQTEKECPAAKLSMNTFPIAGLITTYSSDTLVTDSAAAGTALACGYKTNNGMISQRPDGTNVTSLLEQAQQKGLATGVISTTRITHATPAVFYSHHPSRDAENEIAEQLVTANVDFIAGGGFRHFVPQSGEFGKSKREDDRNLFAEMEEQGYVTFLGADNDAFDRYQPQPGDKAIALFTNSHIPYEIDRMNDVDTNIPSLEDMTEKAIDLLSYDEDGFFLMVEGGRIDHACHINDLAGNIHDTFAFDEAVQCAYEFYQKHPEDTLIVVVADHETGGIGLGYSTNYFLKLDELLDVKVSAEDVLNGIYEANGDREAFLSYIEENCGLDNLTDVELAELNKAMDIVDKGMREDIPVQKYGPSYYNPPAVATNHIISERTNVFWTTYAHSGVPVPISAIGVNAELFGGFKDNTDMAWSLAKAMDLELTGEGEVYEHDYGQDLAGK